MTKVGNTQLAVNDPRANVPDFIRTETETHGLATLRQYIVPPRLKIVQGASAAELKQQFGEGSVLLMPGKDHLKAVVHNAGGQPTEWGEDIIITPLLFFPEWIAWNPLSTKGVLPSIAERTLEYQSLLARKCQNQATWYEECAAAPIDPKTKQKPQIRNTEHLNFIVFIHDEPSLETTPIILSCSRTSHQCGTTLAGLAQSRNASLFAGRYRLRAHQTTNTQGTFWKWEVDNLPEGNTWVTAEQYDAFKQIHSNLTAAHEARLIKPEYDDPEMTVDAGAAESRF